MAYFFSGVSREISSSVGLEVREENSVDYSFVPSTARIALYDDMLSSPRIVEVPPAETMDFIGALSIAPDGRQYPFLSYPPSDREFHPCGFSGDRGVRNG